MRLRTAINGDFQAIVSMLLEMHTENAHFPIDRPAVEKTARGCIAHGFCLALEREGELLGSAGLFVNRTWYSSQEYITDFWFFVREPHRSARAAALLLNGCKAFARQKNMPLMLGVFTKSEPERKTKFFSRAMTPIGGFFLHEAV